MGALRRIHAVLVPGGVLVDTQPLSARPVVTAAGEPVGELDMSEWVTTIDAVDALVAEVLAAGLFELEAERRCEVADTFDSGEECAEVVGGWQGTRVPAELAERLAGASPPVAVWEEVRLRLLRRS